MDEPQNQCSRSYVKTTTTLVRRYRFSFVFPPHCANTLLRAVTTRKVIISSSTIAFLHFLSLRIEYITLTQINNALPNVVKDRHHDTRNLQCIYRYFVCFKSMDEQSGKSTLSSLHHTNTHKLVSFRTAWNSLSETFRTATDPKSFKKNLKDLLFKLCFK